jgi:hypothetical protein
MPGQSNSAPVTHIAGVDVMIGGRRLRQRCAWCGAVLLDYDLTRVAMLGDDPEPPATWPPGRLVRVDGPMSTTLEEEEELPDDACASVHDEVTR